MSHIGQCAVDMAGIHTILYQYVDNDSSQLAQVILFVPNSLNNINPFCFGDQTTSKPSRMMTFSYIFP